MATSDVFRLAAPPWILQRRSIRVYTDQPVSDQQAQALLEAAVRAEVGAPQPWRVLCLLPVGYLAEDKQPRTRFEAGKVHAECWGA